MLLVFTELYLYIKKLSQTRPNCNHTEKMTKGNFLLNRFNGKLYFGAGESIIDFYRSLFLGLWFLTSDGPLDGPHKPNPKTEA